MCAVTGFSLPPHPIHPFIPPGINVHDEHRRVLGGGIEDATRQGVYEAGGGEGVAAGSSLTAQGGLVVSDINRAVTEPLSITYFAL